MITTLRGPLRIHTRAALVAGIVGAVLALAVAVAMATDYEHRAYYTQHGLRSDAESNPHPFAEEVDNNCRWSSVSYVYVPTGEHGGASEGVTCHNHIQFTYGYYDNYQAHVSSYNFGHHAHPSH